MGRVVLANQRVSACVPRDIGETAIVGKTVSAIDDDEASQGRRQCWRKPLPSACQTNSGCAKGFRPMTPGPRWQRLLSEISKWDDRFERQQAPWIELAAGLAAATILMASFWARRQSSPDTTYRRFECGDQEPRPCAPRRY